MQSILDFLRLFAGFFCWLFVWALAFWRGRWPERTAAAVTLGLGLFAIFFRQKDQHGEFSVRTFTIDSLLFLTFLFLAVRGKRIWPVPAAGFQLIAVLTHFAVLIRSPGSTWAYMSVSILATWLVLIAFAVGLWENELRRRLEREASAGQPRA